MARLSREESKKRTRELLIAAAKSEFALVGYGSTSADIIAEKAGFSKGAFYTHFETKEDIFLELLKIHMDNESQVFAKLFKSAHEPSSILNGINQWFITMQNDAEWQLLSVELNLHAKRHSDFAKKFYKLQDEHQKVLSQFVEMFFKLAEHKPIIHVDLITYYIMSMSLGGAILKHPNHKGKIDGQGVVVFLKGLLRLKL